MARSFFSSTVFEELVAPTQEAIGVRLLKQMTSKNTGNRLASTSFDGASHLTVETSRIKRQMVPKSDPYGLGFNPFHKNPELKHSILHDDKVTGPIRSILFLTKAVLE